MRILYLAQFFEPEPMIKGASFVRALIARGHEVQVVTGFPNYPVGKLYAGYRMSLGMTETVEGVVIHRVPLYPSHGSSSIGRVLNYFSYAFTAAFYGIFRAKRFDVIYAYPPPTVALAAAAIGFFRRRPYAMDVQDLWPESVLKSGMKGTGRMGAMLAALCNFIYRRAGRIVAQSRGIAAKLVERGVPPEKIDVIFNWADEEAAAPSGKADLSRYDFEGRFNIVYGGNLGVFQGLDTLVRAAKIAGETVPQLQLLLIGDGSEAQGLRDLVAELDARNVRIEPGIPRSEIGDVFDAADILAIHLLKDPLFQITIPQKTQFYMAMGKPVLVGVEGEAARFILESGAGLPVEPSNVEAMAAAMIQLAQMPPAELAEMGAKGRAAYAREFSFKAAIDATEKMLENTIGTQR